MSKLTIQVKDNANNIIREVDSKILLPLSEPSTDGHFVTVVQDNGKWFLAVGGDNVQALPDITGDVQALLTTLGITYGDATEVSTGVQGLSEASAKTTLTDILVGLLGL